MAEFAIKKLPRPKTKDGSNRVAIFLVGQGGSVSLFRAATAAGDGFGFEIDGAQAESEKPFVRTRATTGRLSVRRLGTTLTFWRSEADGPLEEIGSADFDPGPISEVAFHADALTSGDGFDVRFDRIEILGDRIDRRRPDSADGTFSWASIIVLVAACAIGILIVRRWRHGR